MVNFPDLDTSDDDVDVQVDAARFAHLEDDYVEFPAVRFSQVDKELVL